MTACLASALLGAGVASARKGPAHGFSVLVSDDVGNKEWAVSASHPEGREGAGPLGDRRPCLSVAIREFFGSSFMLHAETLCYGTSGYPSATAEPLFVSMVVTGLSARAPHEVIAAALPTAAKTLRVGFCDGTRRSLAAATLTPKAARFTGLRRFNYAVLVLPASACVSEWTLLDAAGEVLWSGGSE